MNFAFAGNRQISIDILKLLITNGYGPSALLVSDKSINSDAENLIALSGLDEQHVFTNRNFKSSEAIEHLRSLDLDYIIGIHFPHIIPTELLNIPKIGFLNLHPSYLPYNKGWNTPSWAILEGTPFGATLHYMSEALDEGDIIHQKRLEVSEDDTANSLYAKALKLEYEVFKEALPSLLTLNPNRSEQQGEGTSHVKKDLKGVQQIDMHDSATYNEMIDKLRGLTTNDINEAAWFEKDGKRYAVQLKITRLDE